jgi:hypothetical protein
LLMTGRVMDESLDKIAENPTEKVDRWGF